MTEPAQIRLHVAGKVFEGWHQVQVRRSMEEFADSFSLTYSDRWLPSGLATTIVAGLPCRVTLGKHEVLSGFVDRAQVNYDAETHELAASGRSRVADLVDCSAFRKGGAWTSATLADIAADLCAPFEIEVFDGASGGGTISRFAVEPGETVFECISRAAKLKGVLPVAVGDALGFVRTTGTDRTKTVLRYGDNIKSGRREQDFRDRFSEYTFLAQTSRIGDVYTERDATSWTRRILDEEITRYRPMRIVADTAVTKSDLLPRVIWERNVRRGRSDRLHYVVQGWETIEGQPWAPNFRVRVEDERLYVSGEFLIVAATLTRDESGTVTELELTPPEAFSVEPELPKKKRKTRNKPVI